MTRSLKGLAALVSNNAVQRVRQTDREIPPLGCQWLSTLSYTSRERYGEIGA